MKVITGMALENVKKHNTVCPKTGRQWVSLMVPLLEQAYSKRKGGFRCFVS